jgi:phage terminase small subunit
VISLNNNLIQNNNQTPPPLNTEQLESIGLNSRQIIFVKEYIVDMNGKNAAIRAGYSERSAEVQASRMLKNDKVKKALSIVMTTRAEHIGVNADWVLLNLKKVAERCMQAEQITKWDYDSKCMTPTGEYQFDSRGANRSLELIGKHIGMFKDKVEIEGEITSSVNVVFGMKPLAIEDEEDIEEVNLKSIKQL